MLKCERLSSSKETVIFHATTRCFIPLKLNINSNNNNNNNNNNLNGFEVRRGVFMLVIME